MFLDHGSNGNSFTINDSSNHEYGTIVTSSRTRTICYFTSGLRSHDNSSDQDTEPPSAKGTSQGTNEVQEITQSLGSSLENE